MGPSIRGAVVAMLVLLAVAGGCKKQESLIVVGLELAAPDPRATNLGTVTFMTTGSDARMFPIASLSDTDVVSYGLYMPASVKGNIQISALVRPKMGCVGFSGDGQVTI